MITRGFSRIDQLMQEDLEAAYFDGTYIVTYTKVFEPRYSQAQRRWYLMEYPELRHTGWVKRGTVGFMMASEINNLAGFEVLLPLFDDDAGEDDSYYDEYTGHELYSMMC